MPDMDQAIAEFVARLEAHDGFPPLSEAKEASLSRSGQYVSVAEADRVVAVGVVAFHPQREGSVHAAVETAVEPSMRFHEFEQRILETALDLVPDQGRCSVWSRRRSLDGALTELGWTPERTLHEMSVELPLPNAGDGLPVRPFGSGDEAGLVRINADAFADHREAGSLDEREFTELAKQPWFDSDGLLFHEVDGDIAAFCWTKVHPNGEGEIYRIGVGAAYRGRGIGQAIVVAGFGYLASVRSCRTGFLWVDAANEAAMRLYRGIGMTQRSQNVEFTRKAAGGQPKR